jgi:hypothetical protein
MVRSIHSGKVSIGGGEDARPRRRAPRQLFSLLQHIDVFSYTMHQFAYVFLNSHKIVFAAPNHSLLSQPNVSSECIEVSLALLDQHFERGQLVFIRLCHQGPPLLSSVSASRSSLESLTCWRGGRSRILSTTASTRDRIARHVADHFASTSATSTRSPRSCADQLAPVRAVRVRSVRLHRHALPFPRAGASRSPTRSPQAANARACQPTRECRAWIGWKASRVRCQIGDKGPLPSLHGSCCESSMNTTNKKESPG